MPKITYIVDINRRAHTAEFTDIRRNIPLVKVWGDHPDDLATVYRAVASYFLELAHQTEHAAGFTISEYTQADRRAQFDLMTEENPVNIFEEVQY